MSQFIYLQTSNDVRSTHGFSLHRPEVDEDVWKLFDERRGPIWELRPDGVWPDELADQARDVVLNGHNVRQSSLGKLISGLIARNDPFCMTWSNDFRDLPEPRTEAELFELIADQLRSEDNSNWELYVMWRAGP